MLILAFFVEMYILFKDSLYYFITIVITLETYIESFILVSLSSIFVMVELCFWSTTFAMIGNVLLYFMYVHYVLLMRDEHAFQAAIFVVLSF